MMSKKSFFYGMGAIIIWSTTFALSKFILQNNKDPSFNVFTYLALRLMFGLPYLWGTLLISKKIKNVSKVWKSSWKQLLFLGIISFAISYIVQYFGILGTTSNNQAIILNFQTFFVFFISGIIYKNRINPFIFLGAIISFVGLYFILTTEGSFRIDRNTIYGDLMSLLTALLWGSFSAVSAEVLASKKNSIDRLTLLTLVETIASFVIVPFAFVKIPNFTNDLSILTWLDWLAILWLGIGAIGLGYQLWYRALADSKSHSVIVLMYAMPIFSYFFGFVVLDETINWKTGIGSILIIGGLLIAQFLHPKGWQETLETPVTDQESQIQDSDSAKP